MADFSQDAIERFRMRLEKEREELRSLLEQTEQDSAPVQLDQQSVGRVARMDAMRVQAMAQETQRRRQERLPRIEAALRRIATGDFGYCTRCGETISDQRLEVDPTFVVCISCAK